jgi:hypothetical protein
MKLVSTSCLYRHSTGKLLTCSPLVAPMNNEDRDMQEAINLSLGKPAMNGLSPQETGIIGEGGNRVTFGPATKDNYETGQWAMTTVKANAHEIFLNAEPKDRHRNKTVPAFIKPSNSANDLAPLITILHSIPLARTALLFQQESLPHYGHNESWWDGSSIEMPKIIVSEADHGSAVPPREEDVLHEAQRLMAFLDLTERSYGSAESLAKIVNEDNLEKVCSTFLRCWTNIAQKKYTGPHAIRQIFTGVGYKQMMDEDEDERIDFYGLEIPVEESLVNMQGTLYDTLDDIIWADSLDGDQQELFLGVVPQIFCMQLRRNKANSGAGVRIPPIWYADRYLEKHKAAASEMRTARSYLDKTIKEHEAAIKRWTTHKGRDGREHDPSKLFEGAIAYYERQALSDSQKDGSLDSEDVDMDANATIRSEFATKLNHYQDSIAAKVKCKSQIYRQHPQLY